MMVCDRKSSLMGCEAPSLCEDVACIERAVMGRRVMEHCDGADL